MEAGRKQKANHKLASSADLIASLHFAHQIQHRVTERIKTGSFSFKWSLHSELGVRETFRAIREKRKDSAVYTLLEL